MSSLLIYCVLFFSVQVEYTAGDVFAQYSELFGNNSEFSSEDGIAKELFSDSQKRCYNDVMYVLRHLNAKWSIQMLDAAGKMPSGTLLGNGLWMGKYKECLDVKAPPGDGRGDLRGLYCVATWNVSVPTNFHMPLQHLPIKTGLCLPDSCDKLDIERDIKIIMYFIRRLPFVQGHLMHLNSLSCKENDPPLPSSTLMFLYTLCVYFLLLLTGSSVTVMEYVLGSPKISEHSIANAAAFTEFVNSGEHLANGEEQQLCYSERKHHTVFSRLSFTSNFMDLLHSIDNLPFQVISQGTFSVDSFFLISGFLLGYLYLEESSKRNGNISWLALTLHRFLRIVPVYALLIAFNTLVFPHTNSGPFWGDVSDQSECEVRWWWNLLFINNFLPMDSMCMTWTWYLANDFQFFLFGLLLLHIFCVWRLPRLCWILGAITLSGSIILTGCISYTYNLIPPFAGMSTASDYETYKNRLILTWDLIYTKPYCRIGPYLVGLLLAHFLYRTRDQIQPLKLKCKMTGWFLSSFCCLGLIYGVYFITEDTILPHVYNAVSRTTFSLGVAWVIYCCTTNNGGLANRVLSWAVWVPLSRLSFCAYFIHPLLMSWYFDSQTNPVYFTHTNRVMMYFAFVVVSYATAFVTSIAFEAPIINIEKMLKTTARQTQPVAIEMRR